MLSLSHPRCHGFGRGLSCLVILALVVAMLPSQVEASVAKSPSVTIDPNGNRASLAHPNGATTTYTYDQLNRLRELNTTGPLGTIQRYSYTLGLAGNRTKIEEHDGTVRLYDYDELYRLTGETVSGSFNYSKVFTYDNTGNRLRQVTTGFGAGDVSYTYDARDRLLTEGAQDYTWDENGNLIAKSGELTNTWDFENRLVKVQKADGTVVEHLYDPDGNRVQTKTTPPGGAAQVVNYLVDASGSLSHVVAETNGAGELIAYYVRADDLLAVMRPDGGGGFISRFYHSDGLGSIRRLTDEAGNITDGYTYSAFGELLAHTGSDPQPYTFAGEPYDPNIGFYYNRARWLDPRVGRFASEDPRDELLFDPEELHLYLYTRADPVNRTDPSGLFSLTQIIVAIQIRATIFAIAHPVLTAALEFAVIGVASAFAGVILPNPVSEIAAAGRAGATQLPVLARAFQVFVRGLARARLGTAFEDFLFRVVFQGQALRRVVVQGGRVIGFGAGPAGSHIVDFFWRGVFIEAKLSQTAFRLIQFDAFVRAARNLATPLYYFFLKAPGDDFVRFITNRAATQGVTVRVFSLIP